MSSNKEIGRYLRNRMDKDPKFRSFVEKLGGVDEAGKEQAITKLAKEVSKSADPIAAVNARMAEDERKETRPTVQAVLEKVLGRTSPKAPIQSWNELLRLVAEQSGEELGTLDNAHFYKEVLAMPRIVEEAVPRGNRSVYRYYLRES